MSCHHQHPHPSIRIAVSVPNAINSSGVPPQQQQQDGPFSEKPNNGSAPRSTTFTETIHESLLSLYTMPPPEALFSKFHDSADISISDLYFGSGGLPFSLQVASSSPDAENLWVYWDRERDSFGLKRHLISESGHYGKNNLKITDFWFCLEKLLVSAEDDEVDVENDEETLDTVSKKQSGNSSRRHRLQKELDQYVIVPYNNLHRFRAQFLEEQKKADDASLIRAESLSFVSDWAFLCLEHFEVSSDGRDIIAQSSPKGKSNLIESNVTLDLECKEDSPYSALYLKESTSSDASGNKSSTALLGSSTVLAFKKGKPYYSIHLNSLEKSRDTKKSSVFGSLELICKSLQWKFLSTSQNSNLLDEDVPRPSTAASSWNIGSSDSIQIEKLTDENFQFSFMGEEIMCGTPLTEEQIDTLLFRACFELRGVVRVVFFIDFILLGTTEHPHKILNHVEHVPIQGANWKYSRRQKMWKIKSIVRQSSENASLSAVGSHLGSPNARDSSSIGSLPVLSPSKLNDLLTFSVNPQHGPALHEHYRGVEISDLSQLVHPEQLQIKLGGDNRAILDWFLNSESQVVVSIPALPKGQYSLLFYWNGSCTNSIVAYEIVEPSPGDDESSSPTYEIFTPDKKRNCLNQDLYMQYVIRNDFDQLMSALVQKEADLFAVDFMQRTALHLALILNHKKCAALILLFAGEEILSHRDLFGMTAFEAGHFFAHSDTVEEVKVFWSKYSSIAASDKVDPKNYFTAVNSYFGKTPPHTPRYVGPDDEDVSASSPLRSRKQGVFEDALRKSHDIV